MRYWGEVACAASHVTDRDLASVELFSGGPSINRAMRDAGYSAATFDKRDHPLEDLTTHAGFHKALGLVVRLRFAGMCWAAPVCSSWVWVGRYQTERTSNNPASNKINMSVNMANRMVFTCLLLLVAFARGAYIYVEQPLSSLLPHIPVAKALFDWITFLPTSAPLGATLRNRSWCSQTMTKQCPLSAHTKLARTKW